MLWFLLRVAIPDFDAQKEMFEMLLGMAKRGGANTLENIAYYWLSETYLIQIVGDMLIHI